MNNGQPAEGSIPTEGGTPDLLERAYGTLHGLAANYLSRERVGHTLQPTALVHEAYLKLSKQDDGSDWKSKAHFQAAAASAMRRILIDHARGRGAAKRGGAWSRVTLSSNVAITDEPDVDLVVLDEAMLDLEKLDERKSQVVELRFFGGLTCLEAAEHLGISTKTVEADWYFARAWLRDRLSRTEDD